MNSMKALTNSPLLSDNKQPKNQDLSPRSPLHTQETIQKKRLFVRKPGVSPSFILADKKRKQSIREELLDEANLGSFRSHRETEVSRQTHSISQDQSFIGEEKGAGNAVAWKRQMLFNPSPSQSHLLQGLKYIQKNSFKAAKEELEGGSPKEQRKEMDETTDYSGQSLLNGSKSISNIRFRPPKGYDTCPSNKQKISRIPGNPRQNIAERLCLSCRNNKQKCQILTERCNKLEEQLEFKNRTIAELQERIEQLRLDNLKKEGQMRELVENDQEMRQIIETLQRRAQQAEYEFARTFETAKKELQRLNDKVKYSQMENTMLLRFKEEYSMMAKECDRFRYDNDNLKRQLNSIARMDSNFSFSKQKPKQQYQKAGVSQTDRHKVVKTHSASNKEEDTISLDLSEWSVEQRD